MRRIKKSFISLFLATLMLCTTIYVSAAELVLPDGSRFDATYYAENNPDVVAVVGAGAEELASHYWTLGIQEGRLPYQGAADVSASSVITYVNNYRAANGLNALTLNPTLAAGAQTRARELADSQTFAHKRPNGEKWRTVLGKYSKPAGENLARGQNSSADVIADWKLSSSHNALMLRKGITSVGVGVAKGTDGKFYYVMIVS